MTILTIILIILYLLALSQFHNQWILAYFFKNIKCFAIKISLRKLQQKNRISIYYIKRLYITYRTINYLSFIGKITSYELTQNIPRYARDKLYLCENSNISPVTIKSSEKDRYKHLHHIDLWSNIIYFRWCAIPYTEYNHLFHKLAFYTRNGTSESYCEANGYVLIWNITLKKEKKKNKTWKIWKLLF